MTKSKGFSLVEMLVVMGVFSIIAVVATYSLTTSLVGTKKSESTISVRENLSSTITFMERQLYNAESITSCAGDSTQIEYSDSFGNTGEFVCGDIDGSGPNVGYVASGSASIHMTDASIDITDCHFICTPGSTVDIPGSIRVQISGRLVGIPDTQGAKVSIDTTISPRSY